MSLRILVLFINFFECPNNIKYYCEHKSAHIQFVVSVQCQVKYTLVLNSTHS